MVKRIGLGLLCLCAAWFSFCQRRGSSEETVVALVLKTLNHPFFIDMEKGAMDAAQKAGVKLITQAAQRELDVEKQMQIIEDLVQRKVSALCVTPSGSREIVPAIVKANRAGIPVITVDTRVDTTALGEAGGRVETFIGSDNYEGGRMAGVFIAEKLREGGNVAVLEGIMGHETGDARRRGFMDGISKNPGIKIVASQTANWERDQGFNVFQNMLQAHPEIEALFACNDLMALGAIEAIAAAGRTGKILIVGFDALEDAREAIRLGTMQASVAQNPYQMGYIAVENAIKRIRGEKIPADIPVPIEMISIDNLSR